MADAFNSQREALKTVGEKLPRWARVVATVVRYRIAPNEKKLTKTLAYSVTKKAKASDLAPHGLGYHRPWFGRLPMWRS